MDVETRSYGASWRWPILISVVFLNVCLPSLVLSYGVLLVHAIQVGAPQWLSFATPAAFILAYGFTQCWCREAADSWGGPAGYRVMAALGLLSVVASLLGTAFTPYHWQPLVYGFFAGLGSSLVSAQVDAVIFETYDLQLLHVRGICFGGQAVGLALFPHIISALVYHYGYPLSYIVLGGIMLQTLVAIMLLRVWDVVGRPVSFSRYSDRTYAIFSSGDTTYYDNELHDMSKSWKSPSDDNVAQDFPDDVFDNEAYSTVRPPPSPEEKRRNSFGVEILPEIPEESDESDVGEQNYTNLKRLNLAIKRFSAIGDSFTEYIDKQKIYFLTNDKGSKIKENQVVEVTYDNVSPVSDEQREDILNSLSYRCQSAYAGMKRKIWMPSYKVYRLRRKTKYMLYAIHDTVTKPMYRSLFCWKFYPALMLCFIKLALTCVLLVLIPVMASELTPKLSITDSNFLMTLYGFSWLCFLLSNPWLAQTPKRNFKYLTVLGLIISTAACFLISQAESRDMFSVGCVIAGFGYGAITSCWETAVREFLGARLWPKIHSSLETISAACLALFSFTMYFLTLYEGYDLKFCVFVLGIVLSATTFVWLIVSVVGIYVTNMRSFTIRKIWT